MSKKLLLVLLLIVSVVGFVFAQDATEEPMMEMACPEGEATVTVAAGAVGIELELAQEAAQRYMEMCPNITVEVLETPDLATDRLGLYLQFLEAESPDVDVYQIDVIWPGILAEHMIDLTPYVSEEVLASHFPAIVQNNTVDGQLVGIPWFTDAGLLYYRSDLLEKYSLEVPTTWDELEAAAQAIQDGERAEGNEEFWGFVWQGNAYEGLTCDALEWQVSHGGGTIVSPEGEIQVNNPEFVAALERAAGWVGTISPEGVTGYGEEDARAVFQAGNAAFMRNWPYAYSLGNAEDSVIAGNIGVSPLPGTENGPNAATLGGWQLSVSRYSESPDAAASVALFLASAPEQKIRAIEASYNPTIMSLYEDPEVLEAVPFFGSLFDVFTSAVARPSTVTAERYNDVSVLYFTAVHSVLTGEQDAQTAVEDLEIDLLDLLGEGFTVPGE
ncbi:MAG: ABC transporter substrate-binding protein [Anaerolineae bacterium]|jgi:trehalose/maltose transport system substrate-binding protein|nr:ABC transporter substrate-binding protein [Anaerolineae bacterium]